ncbi:MAG: acetyl-CoA decarbonylase/synthase complex subunit gamma [Kiritimatiellaeota bacterium]|nr:acetyl-CoA decarbonylase/synthase complex subunit gamma [Kiritimatiellota bacterium]
MALKALDIFKLLPKTNCKKCGCPTCLAFAMKLAQKQTSLDQCPDVSEASQAELAGASAPPIRLVTIGVGPGQLAIGNETVLFRHEESFYHPAGFGVMVSDTLDAAALQARLALLRKLKFVRVGMELHAQAVAIVNASGQAAPFAQAVQAARALELPMILMSSQAAHLDAVLAACADQRPLIHAATDATADAFIALAKARHGPLAVAAPDLDKLVPLVAKVRAAGIQDIVLDVTTAGGSGTLQALTAVRRLALKKNLRVLGYPCLAICRQADPLAQVAECSMYVAKYAGLVLTELHQPEQMLPLLTVTQNLYTDPRKPIQVEAKLNAIGAVTPDSPLLITTNFSLTYYTVAGEVEASRVPAYIGVLDTEGTSVLTAFASDKLTSEKIAAFLNSDEVKSKVAHRKVIIPGYIAVMSGSLKEDSGWTVLVGPREASGISKFLKTTWANA